MVNVLTTVVRFDLTGNPEIVGTLHRKYFNVSSVIIIPCDLNMLSKAGYITLDVHSVDFTRVISINSVIVQIGVDQAISGAIHAFGIYLDVSKMKQKFQFAW